MAAVGNVSSPIGESSPSDASTPASKASGQQGAAKRKRNSKAAAAAGSKSSASQRELLTPSQKQSNHRNAEVRRRQEITERLTVICDDIVPGAKGLAKSTEAAYTKAHEYLRDMLLEKRALIEQIQSVGGTVPQEELEAVARLEAYYEIEDGSEDDEEGSGESDGEREHESDEEYEREDTGEDAVTAAESLNSMKSAR